MWEYSLSVKQAPTFEASIYLARFVENMIKRRITDRTEFREKRKSEGSSNSNKKIKFSKFDPNNRKSEDKSETRWCEKCKVKSDLDVPYMHGRERLSFQKVMIFIQTLTI